MKYLNLLIILLLSCFLACTEKEAPTHLIQDPYLASGDYFGSAVACNGDALFIGAPGASELPFKSGRVMIYTKADSGWVNKGDLESSYNDSRLSFGRSISVDGKRVIVGAPESNAGYKESGIAMIFEQQGEDDWQYVTALKPDTAHWNANFGSSVAISENTAIVGALFGISGKETMGAAYIFERQKDESWVQTARLKPSALSGGDRFGYSVALEGNTAVVGSVNHSENGERAGAVFIFEKRSDGSWVEVNKFLGASGDNLGEDVAIWGDEIVVGAPRYIYTGGVFVYNRKPDGTWGKKATLRPMRNLNTSNDLFGSSVAISEGRILVGSPHGRTPETDFIGQIYLFEKEGDSWGEGELVKLPQKLSDSHLGFSIDLAPNRSVVGASTFSEDKGAVLVIEK